MKISFVLMPGEKIAICYQANFKRNVHDQNFYDGKGVVDGKSERCLKWGGGYGGHEKLFVGRRGGTEGATTPALP